MHKQLRKAKRCGAIFLVTGILLLITCALTPLTVDTIIGNEAKKSAQLSPENEIHWRDIPGNDDSGIYWYTYMYNCTNPLEVVYKNEKPEFMEYGPYTYREYDTYSDVAYEDLQNALSRGETLSAVYNKFAQDTNFTKDEVGNIDTPMYLTNKALFEVRYQ